MDGRIDKRSEHFHRIIYEIWYDRIGKTRGQPGNTKAR